MRLVVTFILAVLIAIVIRTNVGGDLAVVAAVTVVTGFVLSARFGFGKTVLLGVVVLLGLEMASPREPAAPVSPPSLVQRM